MLVRVQRNGCTYVHIKYNDKLLHSSKQKKGGEDQNECAVNFKIPPKSSPVMCNGEPCLMEL